MASIETCIDRVEKGSTARLVLDSPQQIHGKADRLEGVAEVVADLTGRVEREPKSGMTLSQRLRGVSVPCLALEQLADDDREESETVLANVVVGPGFPGRDETILIPLFHGMRRDEQDLVIDACLALGKAS